MPDERAPVPEKSAAPNSTSRMLKVNTVNTVNGTAAATPAAPIPARRTTLQQVLSPGERPRGMHTKVSNAIAKKPPTPRRGFIARFCKAIVRSPSVRSGAAWNSKSLSVAGFSE